MQKQTKPEPLGASMAKKILVIAIIVSAAVIIGVAGYLVANKLKINLPVMLPSQEKVVISIDKTEYEQGETVKLSVKNNLDKSICFESCNTYFFQKKNVIWREYLTKRCVINFIAECIGSLEVKEIELSEVDFEEGIYRIAVPIYTGCQNKELPCEEDKTIYSNEFTIKEKDETADWKTYRNEEYWFEFKYPSNLLLEEKKDEQASWKNISVFMKSDDFNGYILVNNAGMGTGFEIGVSSEDIQIGNIKTKLEILDSFSEDNQRAAKVSFSKNSNEYFWLFRFDKNNSNRIKLSKEIYSTFKFIEKDELDKNYKLDCTNKTDDFQSKYSWYEKFDNQIDKKWELDTVCYNEKLEKVVYFIHYTKSQTLSDQSVQLRIYDVKNNRDDKEFEINESQCRKINKWSENGDIAYECNFSGPAVVSINTNLYNTETKNNKTIESCGMGNIDPNYTKRCEDKKYEEYFNRNF